MTQIDFWDSAAVKINTISDKIINKRFYFVKISSSTSGFKDELTFMDISDVYFFLTSNTFKYLFESKKIDFINAYLGEETMFLYDNREEAE